MRNQNSIGSTCMITRGRGFTLVELMITMLISGVIMAAIYSAYISQQRTYLAQEQVAEMQQNLRAGLDIIVREIRMAGYDPYNTGGVGILSANANAITVAMVADADGIDNDNADTDNNYATGADEHGELKVVQYDLFDVSGDGVNDLARKEGSMAREAVASHFDAIEFRYLDSAGAVTVIPADIRSVKISLLARARLPDRQYTNSMIYTSASGVVFNGGPYNDNFRRRLLQITVNCRNLGI